MAAIDMIVENCEKFNNKKSTFSKFSFNDMNSYCKLVKVYYDIKVYYKKLCFDSIKFIVLIKFFHFVFHLVTTNNQDEDFVKEKESKIIAEGEKMSKTGNSEGIYLEIDFIIRFTFFHH